MVRHFYFRSYLAGSKRPLPWLVIGIDVTKWNLLPPYFIIISLINFSEEDQKEDSSNSDDEPEVDQNTNKLGKLYRPLPCKLWPAEHQPASCTTSYFVQANL